jgi:lysophospholipase L1-like esterase
MSIDTEEKPTPGNRYDDDMSSWYKGGSDGLEDSWNADNSDYDESDPSSKAKKKSLDSDELSNAEGNSTSPESPSLPGEAMSNIGSNFYKGAAGAIAKANPATAVAAKFLLSRNAKRTGVTGLIVGFILIIFTLLGGSFELIHMRENMLGKSNQIANSVLERRRARSTAKAIRKMARDGLKRDINKQKLKTKFEAKGFKIDIDETTGKVKSFGFEHNGESKFLDLDEPNLRKAAGDFFDGSQFGREASRAFDSVSNSRAVTWKGRVARGVYKNYLRAKLGNWLDRKNSDKAKTNQQKNAENLRAASKEDAERIRREGAQTSDSFQDTDGDGTLSDEEKAANEVVDDGRTALDDEAAKFSDDLVDDPTKSADDLLGTSSDLADELSDNLDFDRLGDDVSWRTLVDELRNKFPNLAGRLDNVLTGAVKFTSAVEVARVGCRVNGTLKFISSAANVYLSIELAKFTLRYLTAADHQKAGLLTGDGLKLFMLYLHTQGPSGKIYLNAPGVQNSILGVSDAKPSAANASRYSTGRGLTGVLGAVSRFLDNTPVVNSPGACKFSNNGFVQIGGALVGVGAAIFSGGSVTAGQVAFGVGLGLLEEVVFMIGEPLLMRSVSGMAVDGYERDTAAGDALGSGWGSLKAMNSGANGLRPTKKNQLASLQAQADADLEYAASKQNLFERYLNPGNGQSLLAKTAFSMPKTTLSFVNSPRLAFASGNVLKVSLPFGLGNRAYAASDNPECDSDDQIKNKNVATDIFCNPVVASAPDLDNDETEAILIANDQVSEAGEITGTEFKEYVQACHSGRPAILYSPEVNKNNTESIVENRCVDDGDPLPGDSVGRNLRYADYYGYDVDEQNFVDDINDDLVDEGEDENNGEGTLSNPNIFMIGDSLTEGMQSLDGTIATKDNLENKLAEKGWQPTIDAQGCRAVYQPEGPIVGDGRACPAQTIIDAHSVVDSPSNAAAIRGAGSVVIALGSNAKEDSVDQFKEKSGELIDKIKALGPTKIYWLNLSIPAARDRETSRNLVLSQIASEKGVTLLDWAAHVNEANGNTATDDNVTFSDGLHHTADGYAKKTSFLLDKLGSPSGVNGLTCPAGQLQTVNGNGTIYYKMPDAPNGEYSIYSSDSKRYGSKELVCALYTVGINYNRIMGGKSKLRIGDLNASGHKSHKWGVAVDVDADGEIAAADHENFGDRYSEEATITFGKLFIDTGVIRNIWWCPPDATSQDGSGVTTGSGASHRAIREHATNTAQPLEKIKCLSGHLNHFHVDILEKYKGNDYEP